MPDLAPAFALADPVERLRAALTALYGWYRETAPMQRRVFGERATVPELDAWVARSGDQARAELATALSPGLNPTLVALALDFWTWDRLAREGLDDAAAAGLMASVAT
jgi:hypothetical protein